MRNYISANAKYYKASRINKILAHNTREKEPEYLLKVEDRKYENKTFSYSPDNENYGDFFKKLVDKKNKILHKKGFYRKDGNDILEFVIGLSEEQTLKYLEDGVDISLALKDIGIEFQKKYGLTPIAMDFHCDEGHYSEEDGKFSNNFHAHLTFLNFDFEKEKTILRTLKKKDWRDMQDLCASTMQKNSLDYVRGEAKSSISKDHLERNELVAAGQERRLKVSQEKLKGVQGEVFKLEKQKDTLNDLVGLLKNDLSSIRESIQELKNIRKNIVDDVSLSKEEKKDLYNEISKVQSNLRELEQKERSKIKAIENLDTIEELENKTIEDVEKILNYSKKMVGYDDVKLTRSIKKTLEKYTKKEIIVEEVKDLDKENEELKNENMELRKKNKNIIDEANQKLSKQRDEITILKEDYSLKSKSLDDVLIDNKNLERKNEDLEEWKDFVKSQNPSIDEDFKSWKIDQNSSSHSRRR